jgi:hypothetical protein
MEIDQMVQFTVYHRAEGTYDCVVEGSGYLSPRAAVNATMDILQQLAKITLPIMEPK